MPECIKCKSTLPSNAVFCPACGKKQAPAQRKHRKRANGSGTIYRMQGNRQKPWAACKNGIFLGAGKTYAEAQKILERITDVDISDKYNLTFAQIYELWKPVHARTVGKSQMDNYAASYKNCPELHDRKFRSLRKSDFQSVILKLEESGKSKSTCEKMLQLFGQLSKWAMDECIVNQNHSQNVTTTASQKSERKPFSDLQIAAMQKSELPAADIALILIGTGARPGELFDAALVNCYSDYFIGGSKTEAGKNRVIAVSPIGLTSYRKILKKAKQEKGQRLIDGYDGNRDQANFRKRDFQALMDEIGCQDMKPYNCRHTFATLAARAGVSQQLLRRMMGHADIKTTDKIYTHLDTDDILAEIGKISVSPKGRAG